MQSVDAWLDAQPTIPQLGVLPLEHVVTRVPIPEGVAVECGVYTGTSIRLIAQLGRPTFGFDSFQGLPEVWDRADGAYEKGFFAVTELPSVPDNVTLVPGWFEDTLPRWTPPGPIALLHVDCDLYSSTKTVLEALVPHCTDGAVVVFDELFNYPGYEDHELKALVEYLAAHPEWRLEWIGTQGPVQRSPTRDEGYWTQSAACRLVARHRDRMAGHRDRMAP